MIDKIIIDADLCIKLGGHKKYTFLYDILPLVADKIYMHTHAHSEVLMPSSAVQQLTKLISEKRLFLLMRVIWIARTEQYMMLHIRIWQRL